MKIVIIQNTNRQFWPAFKVKEEHLKEIKKVYPKAEVRVVDDKKISTVKVISDKLRQAEIVITTPFVLKDLVGLFLPNLKWIHTTSAGVDRLPQSMKESNVIITNSSGVHPIPISEHVFSFILMFARGMHIAFRNQIEKGEWERNFQKFNAQELPDQTIGIVGYGSIGMEVGRLAKLFRMRVLTVTSKTGNLDEVLKTSDYVINCLPLTPNTRHFFDKKKLLKMKNSAFFINIGRGKTVDEDALIEVLKSGKIAGAGLDVFEEEPLPKTSPLWNLKNVILTPHYSGWTPHYMDRMIEIFCKNLKAYLKGKKMPNLVDKQKGY